MGRPKKVTDGAVLSAVARAIGKRGPAGFTIRDVAAEASVSPATVMQRFGSRRGLLLAFVDSGLPRLDRAFAPRPGDRVADVAVRAFGATADEAPAPSEMANHVAMLAEDLGDPELRRRTQAHFARIRAGIGATLRRAVAAGELRASTGRDAAGGDWLADLAKTLEATCHGTLVVWAVAATGTLEQALRDAVGRALAPFAAR